MKNISILGAGNYAMAFAYLLSQKGHKVKIWTRNKVVAETINKKHMNPYYLQDLKLNDNVYAELDISNFIFDADYIINTIPISGIRNVFSLFLDKLKPSMKIINGSKGIEKDSHRTISEIFKEILPKYLHNNIVYLSGPSFAKEIVENKITAVMISSHNLELASKCKKLFSTDSFIAFISSDIIGNEIASALKNVIAIASGIVKELNMGKNTQAALITAGMKEITEIGLKKGANIKSFLGLAGMGDLFLTCTGSLSRNYYFGKELAKGNNIDSILNNLNQTVEGIDTTFSAYHLASSLNIKVPIIELIYNIIYKHIPVKKAINLFLENHFQRKLLF